MKNDVRPQFLADLAIEASDVKLGFGFVETVCPKQYDRLGDACRDNRVGVGGKIAPFAIRHGFSFRACVGALHDRRGGSARKCWVAPFESLTA